MKTLALVGFGRWGKNLARNFHEIDVLKSISDEAPFHIPYEGVIANPSFLDDPSIAQVAIATPAHTHFSLAKKALLAGKDVFVEKPLCLTSAEAKELVAIAEEKRLILMCGHLLSYHPALLKLEELLKQGFFGRLRAITSHRLNFSPLRQEHVHWDLAPHDLTLIFALAKGGLKNIRLEGSSTIDPSIIDTALITLDFEEEVKAHIHLSWVYPFKETRFVVVGEKGMAVFDDTKPWNEKLKVASMALSPYGMPPLEPVLLDPKEPLREECLHFLNCCQTRETPRTDGKHALMIIEALERAEHVAVPSF